MSEMNKIHKKDQKSVKGAHVENLPNADAHSAKLGTAYNEKNATLRAGGGETKTPPADFNANGRH